MEKYRQHGGIIPWVQDDGKELPAAVAGPCPPRQGDCHAPNKEVLRARLATTA